METGFYYLQSRYYDPTLRRFINADSLASTGQGIVGTNMFAYCGNNSILFFDDNGEDYEVTIDTEEVFWLLTDQYILIASVAISVPLEDNLPILISINPSGGNMVYLNIMDSVWKVNISVTGKGIQFETSKENVSASYSISPFCASLSVTYREENLCGTIELTALPYVKPGPKTLELKEVAAIKQKLWRRKKHSPQAMPHQYLDNIMPYDLTRHQLCIDPQGVFCVMPLFILPLVGPIFEYAY